MPRMRWAMRSGWNLSKFSSFSPVEAKRIGLPVTALTESAAPPRASPSSLVMTTPSNSAASAKDSATPTASWPVIASTTRRTSCGCVFLRIFASSAIRSWSMWRRPAVSTMSTSRRSVRACCSAHSAMSTGSLVGALLVDVGAGALADRDQLLDRGGPVDVAGGDRHVLAVLLQEHRQLGAGGGLAGALQAGHQDHGRAAVGHRQLAPGPPHQRRQLLVDDLDHVLAGIEALQHLVAEAALLDRLRERFDDLEVDVRLEQREADLPHRRVDVGLAQLAARADVGEGRLQAI